MGRAIALRLQTLKKFLMGLDKIKFLYYNCLERLELSKLHALPHFNPPLSLSLSLRGERVGVRVEEGKDEGEDI